MCPEEIITRWWYARSCTGVYDKTDTRMRDNIAIPPSHHDNTRSRCREFLAQLLSDNNKCLGLFWHDAMVKMEWQHRWSVRNVKCQVDTRFLARCYARRKLADTEQTIAGKIRVHNISLQQPVSLVFASDFRSHESLIHDGV